MLERAGVVGRAGREHGWWVGQGESMGGGEGGERGEGCRNSVEPYCTLNLWTLLRHLFICISHDCISPHVRLFAHDLL